MNLAEFHQRVDQIWDSIEEQLDDQGCDVDFERQGAVFTITFADHNQIVINKQEALLELWIASRFNGGFHFAYKNGDWIASDGLRFWDCLQQACESYGEQVQFS